MNIIITVFIIMIIIIIITVLNEDHKAPVVSFVAEVFGDESQKPASGASGPFA